MEKWENSSLIHEEGIFNPKYGFFYEKKQYHRTNSLSDADSISNFNSNLIDHKNETTNIEFNPLDVFLNAKKINLSTIKNSNLLPNKIKNPQPKSGYHLYSKEMRPIIQRRNPSATFGEVTKIVAQMWNELSSHDQDEYSIKSKTISNIEENNNELNNNEIYFNNQGDDGNNSLYHLNNQFQN